MSACIGCNLSVGFQNYEPTIPQMIADPSLTMEERHILHLLGDVWNSYSMLPRRSDADNSEFCDAIHRLQQLIALRVARRVDPDVWHQPQ